MPAYHEAAPANLSVTGHSAVVKQMLKQTGQDSCILQWEISGVEEAMPQMQLTQSSTFIYYSVGEETNIKGTKLLLLHSVSNVLRQHQSNRFVYFAYFQFLLCQTRTNFSEMQ